jgi:predicted dehydrogenase
VKDRVAAAQAKVVKAGQKEPAGYSAGETDFENLVKRDDLDVVYIPTPWRWHVPMAVAAMEAGKHVFVEVPAASTLEDCWRLVDTSERTRRHCVMLEKLLLRRERADGARDGAAGLFGELTHAEAAYIHDLGKKILFDNLEGSGGATSTSRATATSIRHTGWGRWRTTSTSIAGTGSRLSSR